MRAERQVGAVSDFCLTIPMPPFFAGHGAVKAPRQVQYASFHTLDWCRLTSVPGDCVFNVRVALFILYHHHLVGMNR